MGIIIRARQTGFKVLTDVEVMIMVIIYCSLVHLLDTHIPTPDTGLALQVIYFINFQVVPMKLVPLCFLFYR